MRNPWEKYSYIVYHLEEQLTCVRPDLNRPDYLHFEIPTESSITLCTPVSPEREELSADNTHQVLLVITNVK